MESLLASLTYKIFLTPLLSLLHILKFRKKLKLKSRSLLIIIPISKIYCQYSIIRHTLSILFNSIFFSDVYNGSYKYWNSGIFQALFTTEHQSCWSWLLNLMKQYLTIFFKNWLWSVSRVVSWSLNSTIVDYDALKWWVEEKPVITRQKLFRKATIFKRYNMYRIT